MASRLTLLELPNLLALLDWLERQLTRMTPLRNNPPGRIGQRNRRKD